MASINTTKIHIAENFSRYPSGRAIADGPHSGTKFRVKFLRPALDNFDEVIIVLDDVMGYPSSFIEEAFGGLVREGYDEAKILKKIKFEHHSDVYSGYEQSITNAIKAAAKQNN